MSKTQVRVVRLSDGAVLRTDFRNLSDAVDWVSNASDDWPKHYRIDMRVVTDWDAVEFNWINETERN